MEKKDILFFKNKNFELEVQYNRKNVWISQKQMSELFGKDQSVISRHINNAINEGELSNESNMQKMHIANSDKPVKFYDLDTVISVGYRVKSQNGVVFRKWATKILNNYMINGYVKNEKRLSQLKKRVDVLNIVSRMDDSVLNQESSDILNVILQYNKSLSLLDDYDNQKILKPIGKKDNCKISYDECLKIIIKLKQNEKSEIFALERNKGLESIINDVYQTFDSRDVYLTVEEKAANFYYFVIKNHVFIDGNKRIAATLFIYFLNENNLLFKNNRKVISNKLLVALTLLIAESKPMEKEIIINLIINFIN